MSAIKHCVKYRNNRILKIKWMISKLAGLALVGVCLLHCLEWDWVRECVVGHVTYEPVHREDLCHWPAVLRSICYVGERLACRELPNNSFLFPYCMVLIILVFPLQCRIRVYCLVWVMHTLKSGYWFFCIVCVLQVLLLLICPIVLHMNCCKWYIWVCISRSNLCWSYLFCHWVVDV
jgi:hypothetical protein